ncbi:MAG: hypothetical protein KAQ67_03470, partial [Gammaproteobacteria bacterium]|nr:hypothetical protein [Gammaproteobacteria bacterium]
PDLTDKSFHSIKMQPDYFIKFSVLFTFLSTPYLAQATSPTTLPLDCTAVPAHTDQLCVATTSSHTGHMMMWQYIVRLKMQS